MFAHTRPVDAEPPPLRSAAPIARLVTRIIPTRDDGHVQLHASFRDGPAILALLGLDGSATAAEVDQAVAVWRAVDLEAALIERGLCGGVVLSRAEWPTHPQGRVVADLPVVTIRRVGDAPPEPLPDGTDPPPASG